MGYVLPYYRGGIFCNSLMKSLSHSHVGSTQWSHETGMFTKIKILVVGLLFRLLLQK